MKTLRDEKILKETIEIMKYIAGKTESEDILALFFRAVFLREDMYQGVRDILAKGAVSVLDSQATREKFGNLVLKVASTEKVKDGLYS
jgi:hypothetical protein